ncbi:MAG: AAA family ATPase [Mycoplasmataceae bacterium]|nr:AAA family ATPase [Mycoplasmataceae bacterium]
MSKNITISGVSAAGKTTIINSLSDKYNTFTEIKSDSVISFWYEKSIQGKTTNHFAKMIMLASRLSYCVNNLKSKKDSIHDRGLIDLLVANELRIKSRDRDFYDNFKKEIVSSLEEIKKDRNIFQFYIVLEIEFDEFKKRILERGRKNEVNNIKRDDSWYRNYHKEYNKLTVKYLEEFNIPYKVINTTRFSKEETKESVLNLLNKI